MRKRTLLGGWLIALASPELLTRPESGGGATPMLRKKG